MYQLERSDTTADEEALIKEEEAVDWIDEVSLLMLGLIV